MRMLSLCSGIGGADLAAAWTGAIEIVGQVELDPFCLSVLARHFPDAKRIPDIREVHGDEFGDIDIVVAGIPCQPHSVAGKRKAARDERDLWPFVRRILGRTRPGWFILENVPGLLSSKGSQGRKGGFFAAIISDLASMGYRVGWSLFGASSVGAPHQRRRVFLVAHSRQHRLQRRLEQYQPGTGCQTPTNTRANGKVPPLAYSQSRENRGIQLPTVQTNTCAESQRNILAHTGEQRLPLRKGSQGSTGILSNPDGYGADTGNAQPFMGRSTDGLSSWLDSARWPATPGEIQHEWEPTRTITEREPYRRARLKALGNAIVPQQIFPLLAAIVAQEQQDRNE